MGNSRDPFPRNFTCSATQRHMAAVPLQDGTECTVLRADYVCLLDDFKVSPYWRVSTASANRRSVHVKAGGWGFKGDLTLARLLDPERACIHLKYLDGDCRNLTRENFSWSGARVGCARELKWLEMMRRLKEHSEQVVEANPREWFMMLDPANCPFYWDYAPPMDIDPRQLAFEGF